jgi:hypothetical protein
MQKSLQQIPASQCRFKADVEFKDANGKDAKTAPIKLTARSAGAVTTPWWGSVVHDMAGLKMHKPRLALDYDHDSEYIIGYLNKFDTSSGDLIASGALTPFDEKDKASEVIAKMRAGVPYESSINFAGDMVIEEIEEDDECEVNGMKFTGPLTVVREWSLRGVAICPYGMDANTPALLMGRDAKDGTEGQMVTATVLKKEKQMSATQQATVETPVVETAVEAVVEAPVAEMAAETVVVEAPVVETPVVEEVKKEEVEAPDPMAQARAEFAQMVKEFGESNAAAYFSAGVSIVKAREDHYQALKAENAELKKQVQMSKTQGTIDTVVSAVCTDTTNAARDAAVASLQSKGMSQAQAAFVASLNIVQK